MPMLFGDFFKDVIFVDAQACGDGELAKRFTAGCGHGLARHCQTAPFWLALAGVAASYYMYMVNPALPAAIKRIFQPVYTLLENKYYLDWFNENIIAAGTRLLGVVLWKGGDQGVDRRRHRERFLEAGGAGFCRSAALQSGFLYHYALFMILGVFVLMTYFVWLNK
jgi:NADH-quinone oxidoreductase subunit L